MGSQRTRTIFVRNDDAGMFSPEAVSEELINVTRLCIEMGVPICHAVVPALINRETVQWLREQKSRHPDLLSIGQHGFRHANHGRGEFGGERGCQEQRDDILAGMQILKNHFGPDFSYWFAAPWVKYNRHTKRICDELGFRIFSGGVSPKLRAMVFNAVGRLLNVNVLGGKVVSYHRKRRYTQRGCCIQEVSTAVDVVADFKARRLKPIEAILERYHSCEPRFDIIGILLHQWVYDEPAKLRELERLICELRTRDVRFASIENAAVSAVAIRG